MYPHYKTPLTLASPPLYLHNPRWLCTRGYQLDADTIHVRNDVSASGAKHDHDDLYRAAKVSALSEVGGLVWTTQ